MAKLIGTAGHVDHGKTSLIRALTGIDADRLPEEKKRGMTIDLGFAHIELPRSGRVSIVDVPGHERFLTNMLAGAQGVDVAILCVAADDGVMPQTREHLQVLDLLPVASLLVALTRSDLVDSTIQELVSGEVRALLAETRFAEASIHPVSAVTGEGLDDLRLALDDAIATQEHGRAGPWYLGIDRVFSVKGQGTVVTGTMMQGTVRTGTNARLEPAGKEVKIRGIQSHEQDQPTVDAGMRTALRLGGIERGEVERGMVIGEPGAVFLTERVDLRVRWLEAPKHAQRVRLMLGTEEVIGRAILDPERPESVQVRLEHPAGAVVGQPAIIRQYSPPRLLGGGVVAVPVAASHRPTHASAKATTDEDRILEVVSASLWGMDTPEICRQLGRTPQYLGNAFERLKGGGVLLSFAGLWISEEALNLRAEAIRDILMRLHEDAPTQATLLRETVIRAGRIPWDAKPFSRILAHWSDLGLVRSTDRGLAHPDFRVQLSPRQEALLTSLEQTLERLGIAGAPTKELAREVGAPPQAIEEITRIGLETGRLVRISEEFTYTRSQISGFIETLSKIGHPFAAAEAKDALGTTRKYIIPILEFMDRRQFTRRNGDLREVVNQDPQ